MDFSTIGWANTNPNKNFAKITFLTKLQLEWVNPNLFKQVIYLRLYPKFLFRTLIIGITQHTIRNIDPKFPLRQLKPP
jgi:hypothetical protein